VHLIYALGAMPGAALTRCAGNVYECPKLEDRGEYSMDPYITLTRWADFLRFKLGGEATGENQLVFPALDDAGRFKASCSLSYFCGQSTYGAHSPASR
jgi:hypothetical protein